MKLHHLLAVSVLLSAVSVRAELTINKTAGDVGVQISEGGAWSKANPGQTVSEGAAVKTGGDGEVELQYPDRSKVWLKPNTQVQVENQRPLLNRLSFLFGSIKAAIPHLKRNQKFEIRTNTAVCAIRGTEFTMDLSQEGRLLMRALYGELRMKVEGVSGEFKVPQGLGFEAAGAGQKPELRLLTKTEEREALEKWDPGLGKDDRQKDLKKKDDARNQIHDYARQESDRQAAIREAIEIVKNSDFEAGRTLTDINGNQTRVDQRMFRPTADSLQVVNMVKRSNYNYNPGATPFGGSSGLTNYVPGQPRLDSMQVHVKFDHNLPDDLLSWPDFFKSNNVKIGSTPGDFSLIMANQSNPLDVFSVGYFGNRNPATDSVTTALYLGAQSCAVAKNCLTQLTNQFDPHWLPVFDAAGADTRQSVSQTGGDALRSFDASPFNTAANGSGTKFWLVSEGAIINNSGSVQTVSSLVNGGQNPFDVLKNTAGEINLMVKQQNGACSGGSNCTFTNVASADFTNGTFFDNTTTRNIDLVVTPDLMLTIVEKLGTALTDAGGKQ